jgi:hypothetical protein
MVKQSLEKSVVPRTMNDWHPDRDPCIAQVVSFEPLHFVLHDHEDVGELLCILQANRKVGHDDCNDRPRLGDVEMKREFLKRESAQLALITPKGQMQDVGSGIEVSIRLGIERLQWVR